MLCEAFSAALPSASSKQIVIERTKRSVCHLFFAAADEHSDDQIADVVRRDPATASRLIWTISFVSTLGNLIVGVSIFAFLSVNWHQCSDCDRPVRWWLVMHAILQFTQVPARALLCLGILFAEKAGQSIEPFVVSLTASPAWRCTKCLSFFQYVWLLVGTVGLVRGSQCQSCDGIARLLLLVVLMFFARLIVAVGAYHRICQDHRWTSLEEPNIMGATCEQIAAIPLVEYWPEHCPNDTVDCSICMCDIYHGTFVRRLPCGHEFHRRCVDEWLQRSKRCPLCIQPID